MKLSELGEDRLVAALVDGWPARSDVIAGPGDDCAVVALPGANDFLLLKTDCVVEGVHFLPNEKPEAIGRKAMARTLSDFAAMAGLPRHALVTLIVPPDRAERWVRGVYTGLRRIAGEFGVAIVGGETSSTTGPAVISISATGTVEKKHWVSRSGGKVGDLLFVTGKLGGSGRGRHLTFTPRIAEARWLSANFPLHAMMDLSDGLGADLPRLARASGVGYFVEEEALPRRRGSSIAQAMSDGEDYELLFALAADEAATLPRKWRRKFPDLALTQIGSLTCRSATGSRQSHRGYVHFA